MYVVMEDGAQVNIQYQEIPGVILDHLWVGVICIYHKHLEREGKLDGISIRWFKFPIELIYCFFKYTIRV